MPTPLAPVTKACRVLLLPSVKKTHHLPSGVDASRFSVTSAKRSDVEN